MYKNYANILSIDGGGLRGIIVLVQLVELEKELKVPICERFQYIAGTSTGSIIAVLLSIGMSAQEILDMYVENASKIFKKRFWKFGLLSSKYDDNFFNSLLDKYVGLKTLIDTKSTVVVPTYNVSKRDKYTFKTTKALKDENDNFLLKDVIRSSAGAPLYFDTYRIKDEYYLDGGLVSNNPTLSVLLSVIEQNFSNKEPYLKINTLSFSTGKIKNPYNLSKLNGGLFRASKSLTKIILEEQAKFTDYVTIQLYDFLRTFYKTSFGKYSRCNSYIITANNRIDDASPKNIQRLIMDGKTSYQYNRKKIMNFITYMNN